MNETMTTILARRSIRKFTAEAIPEDVLKDIAQAALYAPSGMALKTWKFTVISNREVIARLAKAIGAHNGSPDYNMYNPSALIIPSNDRNNGLGRDDNACALENIFLAARSYGVGSVWLNQLSGICDAEDIRPVLKELGIPDHHVVYGMAALGYADPAAPTPQYKPGGEIQFIK